MTIEQFVKRGQRAQTAADAEIEKHNLFQIARRCARCVRGCATDEQYGELLDKIVEALNGRTIINLPDLPVPTDAEVKAVGEEMLRAWQTGPHDSWEEIARRVLEVARRAREGTRW